MNPYKLPSLMKRNARYRGTRESEKYLSSHQEQIYDIRQSHQDISQLKETQGLKIKNWFLGEIEEPFEIITYSAGKTFEASLDQASYPLLPKGEQGTFENVVVKLNDNTLSPTDYLIDERQLTLVSNALQNGKLVVSFTVTIHMQEQKVHGSFEIKQKLQAVDEQVGELERRLKKYENAY